MKKIFKSPFRVTQGFGLRPEYYQRFGLTAHEGIDLIPSNNDWTVLCLEDGQVVKDEDNPRSGAYGVYVTVWHPTIRKATQYCHLQSNNVNVGDKIVKGQKIGIMGATGNTSGSHVHLNLFEVDDNGYRQNRNNGYNGGIDPLPFLSEASAKDDNMEISKENFAQLITKSTNWDIVASHFNIDQMDAKGGDKVIEKDKEKDKQLEEQRRNTAQAETERDKAREERDKALSNVCPDPSDHTTDTSGNNKLPISDNTNSNNNSSGGSTSTGGKNFFQTLIDYLIRFIKRW